MSKLKKCPSCGSKHIEKTAAKRCMEKRRWIQSWTWEEFGFKDPDAKEKEVKKEEKKEFDFDSAFNKLGELITKAKKVE